MHEEEPQPDLEQVEKPSLVSRATTLHHRLTTGDLADRPELPFVILVFLYRYGILFAEGIDRTELPRRAAALTYTTILSIFPLLAVISASASFFFTPDKEAEFIHYMERQFFPATMGNGDVMTMPFDLSDDELAKLRKQQDTMLRVRELFTNATQKFRDSAGGVGVFGFIGLLVVAGLLYYSIESVVNQTWQMENVGTWTQSLTSFVMILMFAPIIIAISITTTTLAVTLLDKDLGTEPKAPSMREYSAGGTTVSVESADHVTTTTVAVGTGDETTTMTIASGDNEGPQMSWAVRNVRKVTSHFEFLLKALPIVFNTLILTVAYGFLPKTKVLFRHAFIGALIAAVLWELAKHLFIFYVWVSSVNQSLAEAFGVGVIFLIWIYFTWLILLVGNLIVYTSQNFRPLWLERVTGSDVSVDSRLHLATMLLLARRFISPGGGFTELELRIRMGVNSSDFQKVMTRLVREEYVTQTKTGAWVLNHPPDQIKARPILEGGCNLSVLPVARRRDGSIARLFAELELRASNICGEMTLSDLLEENRSSLASAGDEQKKRPAEEAD